MIAIATSGHRPDDERIYHKEIKSLINAGYEILYCTRWDEHMDLSCENLRHFNFLRKETSIKNYIHLIQSKIADAGKINLLHIHEFDLLPLAKQLKKNSEIHVIYDVHDTLRTMWETFSSKKGLLKKVINKSLSFFELSHLMYVDHVILANKVFGDNFYEQKGIHTTVVENFPTLDNVNQSNKSLESPLILYQGQISADRGIPVLIDAFVEVKKEIPNAGLKILGSIRSSTFEKIIQDKIKETSISDSIELLSEVKHQEVWKYMQEAHIGVIPSLNLPRVLVDTPTKLFEYMASGCAIVATDVPPVRYFLKNSGQLVEPNNIHSLSTGILSILRSENIYKGYIDDAIVCIEEKYNWPVAEKKLLSVYENLVG